MLQTVADYYYCGRGDVGNVVNRPHAESFPFVCVALAVNTALLQVLFDGVFFSEVNQCPLK